MFGFQRIHDLAWAAGDSWARGFFEGDSCRTTLNGEGLQTSRRTVIFHQLYPNRRPYDPCFYEIAATIQEGTNYV